MGEMGEMGEMGRDEKRWEKMKKREKMKKKTNIFFFLFFFSSFLLFFSLAMATMHPKVSVHKQYSHSYTNEYSYRENPLSHAPKTPEFPHTSNPKSWS